ncbi:YaaL family protein [Peribacillus sp. SI8-4]|uniref:YaaL family protein n=1 Tax=Peribacillus sp. SI8-4 TaxID=3048009 RepID=UPI002552CCD2|nr:YaaL family protein [Peribacillus sp. SI8-4]
MFFRRKKRLRNEFNESLMKELEQLKWNWHNQKSLLEKSVDPSAEVIAQARLAEVKYFYLFREVKRRNVRIKR